MGPRWRHGSWHRGWLLALVLQLGFSAASGRMLMDDSGSPSPACPTQQGNATDLPIDPDTPASACTINATLAPPGLVLVFSDEFEKEGRDFSVKAGDPHWSAADLYYAATQDKEVYKPTAVTTKNGSAVITTTRENKWAYTQLEDGEVYNVNQNITSGMIMSWNKRCFTGGYIEMRAKLPGDTTHSGLWPAFWMMGALGRPGYMASTKGLWPYSFNNATDCTLKQDWSTLPGQNISACPDRPSDAQRKQWGLLPGQGRGAPEIDIVEVALVDGKPPRLTQSFHMAPLLPPGLNWVDPAFYQMKGIPQGYSVPGSGTPLNSRVLEWFGDLTPQGSPFPRPGGKNDDVYSGQSDLNDMFFEGTGGEFATYGVYWDPVEQVMRFYVNGQPTIEFNKSALAGACNSAGQCVPDRIIPSEPMALVINTALSDTFAKVRDDLPLPAHYSIDYVRVYQKADQVNVGCSPPGYPTEQYIACHKEQYIINPEDEQLIRGSCPETS